jgi:hypothetical protein
LPSSIDSRDGVVTVELLCGAAATPSTPPEFLVEVPHGACRRAHYDALRSRMKGDLPDDLHCFFHINTDVGAWEYGRATALRVLAEHPKKSALVVRSLIPRTLIDCNRPATRAGGDLQKGALTAGVPSYIDHVDDHALLVSLHQHYVDVADAAFELVCGKNGGLAVIPHTYGPRTLGISGVGRDIVAQLRHACAPERESTWPLRADVDFLTHDPDGKDWSPPGLVATLVDAFAALGLEAKSNHAYNLHPASLGHTWSTRYPGRVLCLEVRRDHLVQQWTPFEEMTVVADRVDRVADALAPAVSRMLSGPSSPMAPTGKVPAVPSVRSP